MTETTRESVSQIHLCMGYLLIVFGSLLVVSGIIFTLLAKFGLSMLPGDIFVQKGNFTFFFPIVSSMVVSVVLTIVVNLFLRGR